MKARLNRYVAGAAAMVVLAACGSTNSPSAGLGTTTTAGGTETSVDATLGGGGAGSVNDKADVVQATVRIVASGSFRDISEGTQAADWSGTGFIISSDGLVVTNQHVVEGAGSLEVYLDGAERPVNARILGVSECNDLAVIDLDGDGFSYLEWYEGEADPGLDVWVAGFPLGDPEYTLTRGSVSKAEANGETEWASLDYTLEHDARQEPGNSGGPLVDETGHVVGVNYAGGDIGGTGVEHFYSIPTALALPIVDVLKTGSDQDSVGINGRAFYDPDSGLAGLWVSGVRAGSPASDLNIKPGDIVTDLGGRQIVTPADLDRDGYATKAGYCDVLRTQGTERAISIRVMRFDTNEILSGELNNPERPLELEASIANEVTGGDDPTSGGEEFNYTSVSDDTGTVWVDVPSNWADVDGTGMVVDTETWPAVTASPDVAGFNESWDVPGIMVALAPGYTAADIDATLDAIAPDSCTFSSRNDYSTDYLSGKFDVFESCGGTGTIAVYGAFIDNYSGAMVIIAAAAVEDSDLQAIDNALLTVFIAT